MIMAQVAGALQRARLPFHRSNQMQPHPYLAETRKALDSIMEYLAIVDAKLSALERDPASLLPPTPSVDERIAEATSATQVYKALETEFGVDRRTLYGRVERIVKAHGLEAKFPDWGRDVALAKYLASRNDQGKRRLLAALEALA